MTNFITDEEAERALHWLRDNAPKLGEAKKRLVLAGRMVDRVKALEMQRHNDLPVSAQEREAKASIPLSNAYAEEADAAGAYETLRAYQDAAMAKLDAWRTLCASARASQR
jgi:hypothetical protein